MQAMQDVILGLASSVHSSTPVTQEPVATDVPHVEPVATAAIDQQMFFGVSPDNVAAAGTSTHNFSTGEQTFPQPVNSSSFSSVPLGALVEAKLKAKIWSHQYINLVMLTGDSSARYSVVLDAGAESSSWHLKEQPLKKIDTIGSWTDAFLVYMTIYVERFPAEVAQMLKYVQLVRGMASGRNMFLQYDRDFRKLRAANAMNWDVLHYELYLSLSMHARPFSGGGVPTSGPKQSGGVPKSFASRTVLSADAAEPVAPSSMNVPNVGRSTPLSAASVAPGPNHLPTPINVDALSHLLKLSNYDRLLSDELVHCFRCGFRIPFDGVLPSSPIHNHSSVLNDVSTVDDMLSHEISLGRIAGPFSEVPLPNFVLSPLRLVPKKDSLSFRLIHNLSFPWGHSVNSGIPRQFCTVAYEDYYDFLVSLVADAGSGCFLAKADIESAFRIIPISPRDYHLLGFSFNNMYYYDRCLPMGCSVSCQVFDKLSCALQWILQKHFLVLTMSHILDDFIFISPSSLQCNMFLN